MKNFIYIFILSAAFIGCNTAKNPSISNDMEVQEGDTIRIASEETEYEIIIIEPGFNNWLLSVAQPEGYYSQQFMETWNYQYVIEYNRRVLQPSVYNPNLYEQQIDYQSDIDYGYEVNYKLYNYFIYFQQRYNQRLAGRIPRR